MPEIYKSRTGYNGYYYSIVRDACSGEFYAKIYDVNYFHIQDTYFRLDENTPEIEAKQYIDEVLNK